MTGLEMRCPDGHALTWVSPSYAECTGGRKLNQWGRYDGGLIQMREKHFAWRAMVAQDNRSLSGEGER